MKLNEVRKLVAYTLTTLSVVVGAIMTGGWSVLTQPDFIAMVSTLIVGGYAVWGTPNDTPKLDELVDLIEKEKTNG